MEIINDTCWTCGREGPSKISLLGDTKGGLWAIKLSLKKGLITLIPKKDKDRAFLKTTIVPSPYYRFLQDYHKHVSLKTR